MKQDSILDIPPSWVRQLTLSRDLTALRYPPRGQRTIMYRRAKAELFAENVHAEGTIMRLTLYKVRLAVDGCIRSADWFNQVGRRGANAYVWVRVRVFFSFAWCVLYSFCGFVPSH